MKLKYLTFLIGLILIVPLRNALQRGSLSVSVFWFSIGTLCFLMPGYQEFSIGLVSWGAYPGHTSGMEVTVVDLAMLAYFLTLPKSASKLPFTRAMALYFLCVLVSGLQADLFQPTLFYAWQLFRMFWVYLVVSRACADSQVGPALLKGMAFGLLIEGGMVVYGRFLEHELQPHGTFPHQNYLGLISNMAFIPLLMLNLAKKVPLLVRSSLLSGALVAVFTASRATLGLATLGALLVFGYSLICGQAGRRMKFVLIAAVVAIPLIPVAMSSMDMRASQFDSYSVYDERAAFENAAALMIRDHPLGVGANNFVIAANTQGYYDLAGVAAIPESRSTHVHNLYYLTAAELGYPGLLALTFMLLQPLLLAFRCSWHHRGTEESAFLGGLGIALLLTYVHSNYEWVVVSQYAQYFLAITFGLVAGTSGRLQATYPAQRTVEAH